ncbi:MAG: methyltransferase domain-containing protein [Verrucomicrobiota bacterium]
MKHFLEHRTDFSNPRTAAIYDELSFWSSRFGHLLFQHLAIRGHLKILDVGCGTGFSLMELAQVYGPSCKLVGVDVWPEAIERAKSKRALQELSNVEIVEADAAHLPFPSSEFDLLASNLGLNNFDDPGAVLQECFRVSKNGGHLALTTNIKGHMQEFYAIFREILRERDKSEELERLQLNEDHRGTRESVCGLLEMAGFRVGKVVEESFVLRYLDGTALFNHSLTKFGFLDGWRAVVNPADEKEIFALLETKLNSVANKFGELRMTIPMLYVEGEKP